jgi:hypothetical protein
MREEEIVEVGLDADQRVHVRPEKTKFEYIYRSAMGVHWNASLDRLSHSSSGDWTQSRWFRQIITAVAAEYCVRLRLTSQTEWTDIVPCVRSAMEAATLPDDS